MSNIDLLQRFIFENAPIRGEIIHLQESYQAIIKQYNYPEPIRKLLGEALCVVGLLSAIIKFNGRVTLQFRGKGKLKLLLAQCENNFHIRGLVKWDGELSYNELMDAFQDGILAILLDSGPTQRYQGMVSWKGNSLAESVENYFKESEQLATKIYLAVDDYSAAGFLLQAIPNSSKDLHFSEDEKAVNSHWQRIVRETPELKISDFMNIDYGTLLNQLYPEDEIRIFHPVDIEFQCTCSRKKGEDAILLLGRKEAEEELHDKSSIEVTCDFCNKKYLFDKVDVYSVFEKNDKLPPESKLH